MSRPQQRALELLVLDRIQRSNTDQINEIKLAILSNNPAAAPKLWPDWFPETEEVTEENMDEMLDGDGEYRFNTTDSPEEMEALIASLGVGTMTLSDLDSKDPGEWM